MASASDSDRYRSWAATLSGSSTAVMSRNSADPVLRGGTADNPLRRDPTSTKRLHERQAQAW